MPFVTGINVTYPPYNCTYTRSRTTPMLEKILKLLAVGLSTLVALIIVVVIWLFHLNQSLPPNTAVDIALIGRSPLILILVAAICALGVCVYYRWAIA